jgi:hypothetical protein
MVVPKWSYAMMDIIRHLIFFFFFLVKRMMHSNEKLKMTRCGGNEHPKYMPKPDL